MAKVCIWIHYKPGFFGNQTKSSKWSKGNPDIFVEVKILDLKRSHAFIAGLWKLQNYNKTPWWMWKKSRKRWLAAWLYLDPLPRNSPLTDDTCGSLTGHGWNRPRPTTASQHKRPFTTWTNSYPWTTKVNFGWQTFVWNSNSNLLDKGFS